jgi:hypothetical protein
VATRRDSTAKQQTESENTAIPSAKLEPIRVVVRELTRPDGKKMKVQVPVYPPFELDDASVRAAAVKARAAEKAAAAPARARKQPRARR